MTHFFINTVWYNYITQILHNDAVSMPLLPLSSLQVSIGRRVICLYAAVAMQAHRIVAFFCYNRYQSFISRLLLWDIQRHLSLPPDHSYFSQHFFIQGILTNNVSDHRLWIVPICFWAELPLLRVDLPFCHYYFSELGEVKHCDQFL
jgi:hypothetical protein